MTFPATLGKVIGMSSLTGPDVCGAGWRKSRHSMANGNCVEAASIPEGVTVRDSAKSGDLILFYPPDAWRAFIAAVKSGESGLFR